MELSDRVLEFENQSLFKQMFFNCVYVACSHVHPWYALHVLAVHFHVKDYHWDRLGEETKWNDSSTGGLGCCPDPWCSSPCPRLFSRNSLVHKLISHSLNTPKLLSLPKNLKLSLALSRGHQSIFVRALSLVLIRCFEKLCGRHGLRHKSQNHGKHRILHN